MPVHPDFPIAAPGIYLDTAAEGLPAPGVEEAVAEYLREKRRGTPGRKRHFEAEFEARRLASGLLGARVEDVTYLPTASDAINLLAASLPWQPGDRIVTSDIEFPSNILPWLALRERGVQVHVAASRDGALHLSDLLAALDSRTRLVTISQVSYKTGAWFPDTDALAKATHEAGAVLCVDATQSLGRCPTPLAGVDYLMASTFKWLLGVHGAAITYLSPQLAERISLSAVGWYSVNNSFVDVRERVLHLKAGAARLVAGMPNFAALYAAGAALRFLSTLDLPAEQARANALTRHLRRRLAALGLPLLTPEAEQYGSGIVSFAHPDGESVMRQLAERNITVWGGDGRVRASIHYYNQAAHVDALVQALEEVVIK